MHQYVLARLCVPFGVDRLSPQEVYRRGTSLYSTRMSAGTDQPALRTSQLCFAPPTSQVLKAEDHILSLTVFIRSIWASSPSRIFFNASPTFTTTLWQVASSFDNSSACCTKASKVPILNSGIGNGAVEPLSGETVAETASRASSRW